MRNKLKIASLVLASFALTSCKTSLLYGANDYMVNDLAKDYYSTREITTNNLGDPLASEITLDPFSADKLLYSNGLVDAPWTVDGKTRKGALELFPSIYSYKKSDGTVSVLSSSKEWTYHNEGYDSEYIGTSFGRTKCLAITDSAFRNTGVLGKLYNGQLFCDGDHVRALIQLGQEGYTTVFPKTLSTGDYFLMSCRGGSSFGKARTTAMDIQLNFFKVGKSGYDFYTVNLSNALLRTDSGGEADTFIGFRFSDIGIDPSGIKGMGLTFSNVKDGTYQSEENFSSSGALKNYFALLVYEVMFPDSSWR